MARTAELIDSLAADGSAVRPIGRPFKRALAWLAAAAAVIAAMTAIMGIRPDLADELADPMFCVERAAALLTGVSAAIAAFRVSVPGRSLHWLWLPVPFAAVWIGGMGYGCVEDWALEGEAGLRLGRSYECLAAIMATSLPLGVMLLVMVRHAARVRRIPTAIAGGLALAATAEAGLTLYHQTDATLLDILIHLLGIAVVVGVSISASSRLFRLVDVYRSRLAQFRREVLGSQP
jgi:hypothetical protein